MMRELILQFTDQLRDAISIGEKFEAPENISEIRNVLICGLGGSGIGGEIAKDLSIDEAKYPIEACKNYDIPGWVDEYTLCICSSYSGNTEETLEAYSQAKKKNAQIAVITSGGKILELAEKNGNPHIVVPGGMPPRGALAYSLTQQLILLEAYGIIPKKYIKELKHVPDFLDAHKEGIQAEAAEIANVAKDYIPMIYVNDGWGAVATRWRQQFNENSKMLAWERVIPEMNHNELVGWADTRDTVLPIFITTESDLKKNKKRMKLVEEIISEKVPHYMIVEAKGKNKIEQCFYLINLGDYISMDMADLRKVDAMEINVINYLKSELSKN